MALFGNKDEVKPAATAPVSPAPVATPAPVAKAQEKPKKEKIRIPTEYKSKFTPEEIKLYESNKNVKGLNSADLAVWQKVNKKLRDLKDQKILKLLKEKEKKGSVLTRDQRTHALCLITGELFADGSAAGTELLKKMVSKEWKKKSADALTLFAKEKKLDLAFKVKKDA